MEAETAWAVAIAAGAVLFATTPRAAVGAAITVRTDDWLTIAFDPVVTVSIAGMPHALPPTEDTRHRNTAPFSVVVTPVMVSAVEFAPWIVVQVLPPSLLLCHWYRSPEPFTWTLKVAVPPTDTVCFCGCWVMIGLVPVLRAPGPYRLVFRI